MKRIAVLWIIMVLSPPSAVVPSTRPIVQDAPSYVLEKLRACDMVFMGTTHQQASILSLIADLLPHLHSVGVTHVALEIASDQQGRIDHFFETGAGLSEIEVHAAIDCIEFRHLLSLLAGLPSGARPQVRAVDLPANQYAGLIRRDQWMADALGRIVQERPDAKVFAVLGSMHVLRKLDWCARIAGAQESIRTRLQTAFPALEVFSIVNIVGDSAPGCDFGRHFGSLPDSVAVDLDQRFTNWRLGLMNYLAIRPAPPHELVEGVIVY